MMNQRVSDRKVLMALLHILEKYNVISPVDVMECINAGIDSSIDTRRKKKSTSSDIKKT